jgi:hypothetical protein
MGMLVRGAKCWCRSVTGGVAKKDNNRWSLMEPRGRNCRRTPRPASRIPSPQARRAGFLLKTELSAKAIRRILDGRPG